MKIIEAALLPLIAAELLLAFIAGCFGFGSHKLFKSMFPEVRG